MTWIQAARPAAASAPVLVLAVPCAGATHAQYASWAADAPPALQLRAVALPGRGAPDLDLLVPGDLAEQVVAEYRPSPGQRALVVLGHSFGGLVAFEMARLLAEAGHRPDLLVLSGAASAPPSPDEADAADAADDETLVAYLRAMGSTPDEVLEDEDFRAYLLRHLRRDLAVGRRFDFASRPRLDVPLLAVAGSTDPVAGPERMRSWLAFGDDTSELVVVEGGHAAVNEPDPRRAVLAAVEVRCAASIR